MISMRGSVLRIVHQHIGLPGLDFLRSVVVGALVEKGKVFYEK